MPSLSWNRETWEGANPWTAGGDDWSAPWGGPELQWSGCVYPRLARFLPARHILEIAPGFGRWTQFLTQHCDALMGVDLSQRCVAACRERFAADPRATFHVNDGRSLPMVPNGWADVAFSFDSLVHVELDVIAAYLRELASKLSDNGVAVLHHSNALRYARSLPYRQRLAKGVDRLSPGRREWLKRTLSTTGLLNYGHLRGTTVSARRVVDVCESAGLTCVVQELVNWASDRLLIDCVSVITRPRSRWDQPYRLVENRRFMDSAMAIRLAAATYGGEPRSCVKKELA